MNTKIKQIRVATLLFLLAIVVLTGFVIKEQNIMDLAYLILIIFYFVKFLIIKRSS